MARRAGCSRAEARRLIDGGAVRVDGRRAVKGRLLGAGATVELERAPAAFAERSPVAQPELPLDVAWSDDAVIAMVKPFGVPTHPLRAGERGTLANALVARFPECAAASDDPREGGVAHRLDVDTSGVLLAARTPEDWRALRRAFASGQVEKEYWALVDGAPPDDGEVRAPLAHAGARKMRALDDDSLELRSRQALTRFHTLQRGPGAALVRVTTSTGRMHQVRVHLAHAGHPLYGDALYGGPPLPPGVEGGHVLHAARITFPHPRDGRRVTVAAPPPPARAALITALVGADWLNQSGNG